MYSPSDDMTISAAQLGKTEISAKCWRPQPSYGISSSPNVLAYPNHHVNHVPIILIAVQDKVIRQANIGFHIKDPYTSNVSLRTSCKLPGSIRRASAL